MIQEPKQIVILSFDGAGKGKVISLEEFQATRTSGQLFWVRVNLRGARKFLKDLGEVPPFVADVLCTSETRPRSLVFEEGLCCNFRGVNLHQGSEPEDMVSVRLWMKQNLIVTVQRRSLVSTNEIEQKLLTGSGPKNAPEFLISLLNNLLEKTEDVVCALDDELDKLEDQMAVATGSDAREDRATLGALRRRIIMLRRYLIPQREAINRLQVEITHWLTDLQLMQLREVSNSMIRLLEDLDAERDRGLVLHEEVSSLAQERINAKIYLLSVVTVIFMPLTFITGLLGINVSGIPESHSPFGFAFVCIGLMVLAMVEVWILRKNKWL